MSKTLVFILILLLSLTLGAKQSKAELESCPGNVSSNPPILYTDSNNVAFAIYLADQNRDYFDSQFTKWTVEFDCGLRHGTVEAQIDVASSSKTLSTATLVNDRSGNMCEFHEGNHTLIVKGDDKPRCRAKYYVKASAPHCELIVSPLTGITQTTPIKVKGKNLGKGVNYNLFMDKEDQPIILGNFGETSEVTIPQDKVTPGTREVYLRERLNQPNLPFRNGLPFGPKLCPKKFTVGNTDKPGKVLEDGSSEEDITSICTNNPQDPRCATGGGTKCDVGRGNAIQTAIGCIHTNPPEFVKDLMTWVIGIGGGLAFLMMLLGAFQMLTSAGNPETLNAGRDRLTSAVIGLLMVIFAILLLQIIGFGILKIPGFEP